MPPSRDEDLDWLYGRDRPQPSEPEPTRVLPPDRSLRAARAVPRPPVGRPPARPAAGDPPPPAYPAPAAGRPQPAPPGPRRPPAAARPARRSRPPRRRPAKPPKRRHPVRSVLAVLASCSLLLLVWLVARPGLRLEPDRAGRRRAGRRPPRNQPGTTFLLVGSDSREGLTKAEQKRLGTGSTAGQRTDTIMILYIPPGGQAGADLDPPRLLRRRSPATASNKINAAYAFGGAEAAGADRRAEHRAADRRLPRDRLRRLRQRHRRPRRDRDVPAQGDQGQGRAPQPAEGLPEARAAPTPSATSGCARPIRAAISAGWSGSGRCWPRWPRRRASPASVLNPVRYWNALQRRRRCGQHRRGHHVRRDGHARPGDAQGLRRQRAHPDRAGLQSRAPPPRPAPRCSGTTTKAKAMFADIARGDTSELEEVRQVAVRAGPVGRASAWSV